jgi:CheY-like chemotaxis protein
LQQNEHYSHYAKKEHFPNEETTTGSVPRSLKHYIYRLKSNSLPYAKAGMIIAYTHANMAVRRKKAKILVADSEKNTREAVVEIFSEAGYDVSSASSGSETIEHLTRDTFDLIFCDIDMPRTSGSEIVRMARALNQKARIVVLSSSGAASLRSRMKKEGAYDLLVKPLRKARLLKVAKEALARPPSRKKVGVS